MKKITRIKKSISVITALCLLVSFVIGPSAANAMTNEEATKQYKQIFKEFVLPYSYGQITSAHYAGTDRVIINIQDLHCHPKVQKNISNIIETFDKSYGVNKIYLEGAYGQVSTKWITEEIKRNNISNLLDKMLETGRLTGAEYYSAASGKTEIINGLEEKEPYLDNLKRFGDIIENQDKINLILNTMEESLINLKKKYYTKRQYKLEKLSNDYKEGKITSQKYYALLSKHIDRLGIDLSKYENTYSYIMLLDMQKKLNYSKITNELQNLVLLLKEQVPYNAYKMLLDNTENLEKVDKLYVYLVQIAKVYNLDLSVNFPNLDEYFGYIEFSQKINPLELIEEEQQLIQEINTMFSETRAQREVVFLTSFSRYVKDYVSSKITSSDYEYYKENIETYKSLWNEYVDNRVLSLLEDYIVEADKFYKINTDRNVYFTNNMFGDEEKFNKIEVEVEAKGDVNKIIENMKGVKEVDVVVTGGFHSQTVTEILKNQGVSYIVITPNVTDGVKLAEETYYEIAKEQSKISFQALANLIASLSPQSQKIIFDLLKNPNLKPEQIQGTEGLADVEKQLAILIKKLQFAKMLESDDIGDIENKVIEILKENVDENHKDMVTPEVVEQLRMDSLENLSKLEKALEMLSKSNVFERSYFAVSDTLSQLRDLVSKLPVNLVVDNITVEKQPILSKNDRIIKLLPRIQQKYSKYSFTEYELKGVIIDVLDTNENLSDRVLFSQIDNRMKGIIKGNKDKVLDFTDIANIEKTNGWVRKYYNYVQNIVNSMLPEKSENLSKEELKEKTKKSLEQILDVFGGYENLDSMQATILFYLCRDNGFFEEMINLYEKTSISAKEFKDSIEIRELYFVAFNKTNNYERTIEELENMRQTNEEEMNGELYGALGKAYYERYKRLKAEGASDDVKKAALEASYEAYNKGFVLDYYYYPGINAVYRLRELAGLSTDIKDKKEKLEEAENLAKLVYLSTEKAGGIRSGDYWTIMTMVEAMAIGGLYDETILDKALTFVKDDWQIDSPLENLERILEEDKQSGKSVENLEKIIDKMKQHKIKLGQSVQTEQAQKTQQTEKEKFTEDLLSFCYRIPINSLHDSVTKHISGNYKFGGGLQEMQLGREDVKIAMDILQRLGLDKISDISEFMEKIDVVIRRQYRNDALDMENLKSKGHGEFDDIIKELKDLTASARDTDSRTNIILDFLLGVGDCRQHGEMKQVFFDVWKEMQLHKYYEQARKNPRQYKGISDKIKKLQSKQLLTMESLVRGNVAMNGLYIFVRDANGNLIYSKDINDIEEHVLNILVEFDEEGNIKKDTVELADSFYQHEYKFGGKSKEKLGKNSFEYIDGKLSIKAGTIVTVNPITGKKQKSQVYLTAPNAPYAGFESRVEKGGVNSEGYNKDTYGMLFRGIPSVKSLLRRTLDISNIDPLDLLRKENKGDDTYIRKKIDEFLLVSLQYFRDTTKKADANMIDKIINPLLKVVAIKDDKTKGMDVNVLNENLLRENPAFQKLMSLLLSSPEQTLVMSDIFHTKGYYEDIRDNKINNKNSPVIDTRLFDEKFNPNANELLDCLTDDARKTITERHFRSPEEKIRLTISAIKEGKLEDFFRLAGKDVDVSKIGKETIIINTLQVPWEYLINDIGKYGYDKKTGKWDRENGNAIQAARKQFLVEQQTNGIAVTIATLKYLSQNKITDAHLALKLIHAGWSVNNYYGYEGEDLTLHLSHYDDLSYEEKRKDYIFLKAIAEYLQMDDPAIQSILSDLEKEYEQEEVDEKAEINTNEVQNVMSDIAQKDLKDVLKSLITLASIKERAITDEILDIYSLGKLDAYSRLKKFFSDNKEIALMLSSVFHNKGYYEPLRAGIEDKNSTTIDTRLFDKDYIVGNESPKEAEARAEKLLSYLKEDMRKNISQRTPAEATKSYKIKISDLNVSSVSDIQKFYSLMGKNIREKQILDLQQDSVIGNTLQVPWEYLVDTANKYEGAVDARKEFLINKQIDGAIVTIAVLSHARELSKTDSEKAKDIRYFLSLIHAGWSANNSWSDLSKLKYPSNSEEDSLKEKDGFLSREEILKDWEYFRVVAELLNLDTESEPTISYLLKTGRELYNTENKPLKNKISEKDKNTIFEAFFSRLQSILDAMKSLVDIKFGEITADILAKYSLQELPIYKNIKNFLNSNKETALMLSSVFHNKGYYEPLRAGIEDKNSTTIDTRLFDKDYIVGNESPKEAEARAEKLLSYLKEDMRKNISQRTPAEATKSYKIKISDLNVSSVSDIQKFYSLMGKNIREKQILDLQQDSVIGNTLQVPWEYLVDTANKYEGAVDARKEFLINKQIDGVIVVVVSILDAMKKWNTKDTISKMSEEENTEYIKQVLSLIHAGWSANNSWSDLAFLKYPERFGEKDKEGYLTYEEILKDGEYFEAVVKALHLTQNPVISKLLEQWNMVKSIKSQQEIAERVKEKNPTKYTFVKPKPMIGYRITSDRPEDIPRVIWDKMGMEDKAKYTSEYLSKHIGDVVALQLKADGSPDFYVAGGFSKKYKEISLEEVRSADATLMPSLFGIEGIEDIITNGSNIVGASRIYPSEMIKMSDLGYSIDEEVRIYREKVKQTQRKPAGKDAYLVFMNDEYYMVNIDPQTGMPIGYSSSEESISTQQTAQKTVTADSTAVQDTKKEQTEQYIIDTATETTKNISNPSMPLAQQAAIRLITNSKEAESLIEQGFKLDENLVVLQDETRATELRKQGINALLFETSHDRGGVTIGELSNKTKVRVKVKDGKIIFCVRKSGVIRDSDIDILMKMLVEKMKTGKKIKGLENIKNISYTDNTEEMNSVINMMKNAHVDSITSGIEQNYRYSEEEKESFGAIAKKTGLKTFEISKSQAKKTEAYKGKYNFIFVETDAKALVDQIKAGSEESRYILDLSVNENMSVEEALQILKDIQKAKLSVKGGLNIIVTVRFNDKVIDALSESKVNNIYETYGVIPRVSAAKVDLISGKKEVDDLGKLSKDQLEALRGKEIIGMTVDKESVVTLGKSLLDNIKTILESLNSINEMTPQRKYKKGLNAAMSTKFDYSVTDMKTLIESGILSIDFEDREKLIEELNKINKGIFSVEAQVYIKYQMDKKNYEEVLGFIRGCVMNSLAGDISRILDLEDTFKNAIKSNEIQAVLILTLQGMMAGKSLEELYENIEGSDEKTAKEYLEEIRRELNENLEKVLKENEYRINNPGPGTLTAFKGIPELLMDSYGKKATVTAQVQISAIAVRKILAAA